jgi:hypothetical protein
VITDLIQIQRLGEKKRGENARLRTWLKAHRHNDLRLRRIAEEIESQIDCTICGNCCRVATVEIKEREVERLAKAVSVPPSVFLRDYCERDEDGVLILKRTAQGCQFLDGNLCVIYEHRPTTCAHFPHLVRGEGSLESRMWQMPDRACYCPIVYNTLEAYKEEVRFQG